MSMGPTSLYHFDPVTDTELLQIISCMNKTTCSSDPFPTRLLMSHVHAIIPILQHIVNLCLTTGDFPISCIFYFIYIIHISIYGIHVTKQVKLKIQLEY